MMKKILMLMALWLSFSGNAMAKDIQFHSIYGHTYNNDIVISTGMNMKKVTTNPKDWIAVYKKGDSNAWGNVKLWIWAKNLKEDEWYGDKGNVGYTFKNANLPAGTYEVRCFLNNSFKTRLKSKPFIVATDKLHAIYSALDKHLFVEVRNENFKANNKDWIGIYRRGDSNDWGNVREWFWAKDLKRNFGGYYSLTLKNPDLSSGEYVARYFLNNSFTTDKESKPFKVKTATDNELYGNYNIKAKKVHIEILNGKFKINPKDWLAVYEVGDSNAWKNVKLWIWAKDLKKNPHGFHYDFKNVDILWGAKLELRYFLNNSFVTNKTSKPFQAQ